MLRIAVAEKDVLIDADLVAFWEIDHYRGWLEILVSYTQKPTAHILAGYTRAALDAS